MSAWCSLALIFNSDCPDKEVPLKPRDLNSTMCKAYLAALVFWVGMEHIYPLQNSSNICWHEVFICFWFPSSSTRFTCILKRAEFWRNEQAHRRSIVTCSVSSFFLLGTLVSWQPSQTMETWMRPVHPRKSSRAFFFFFFITFSFFLW